MAALIGEINSDMVFLGGDVMDEDVKPVIKYDLGKILKKISSKYPVYAITGNHEYYGGVDKALGYLEKHSVTILRDKAVKIRGQFYLIGRDDKTKNDFEPVPRKELRDILKDVDADYPIVLMEHNPQGVKESVENKIDLMRSGSAAGPRS